MASSCVYTSSTLNFISEAFAPSTKKKEKETKKKNKIKKEQDIAKSNDVTNVQEAKIQEVVKDFRTIQQMEEEKEKKEQAEEPLKAENQSKTSHRIYVEPFVKPDDQRQVSVDKHVDRFLSDKRRYRIQGLQWFLQSKQIQELLRQGYSLYDVHTYVPLGSTGGFVTFPVPNNQYGDILWLSNPKTQKNHTSSSNALKPSNPSSSSSSSSTKSSVSVSTADKVNAFAMLSNDDTDEDMDDNE